MASGVTLLLYLAVFSSFLLACGLVGYWILQPLGRAVKGKRRPTRFSMIDFIWLSIMATGALAPLANFASAIRRDRHFQFFNVLAASMVLFVVAIVWWRGIATLSGLGIKDNRRRGVFLIVVLPAALAISVFGIPMLLALFWGALREEPLALIWWVPAALSTVSLVIALRYVSFWILAGANESDVRER